MSAPLEVLVWNEFRHETRGDETVMRHYPDGIHRVIADGLTESLGDAVSVRTATLPEPEHGLTEEALAKTGRSVSYVVVAVDGPAHARHFSCAAQIDGEELGAGTGHTKKESEQEAAKQALAAIGA